MRDELRRMALFTSGVGELTRYRAEEMVKELIKAGEVGRDQASALVRELLDRSRANRSELTRVIGAEIRRQIEGLGLATKRDVQRLERRVNRLEERSKTTAKKTSKKAASAKKTTTRRSSANDSSGS